MTKLLIIGIGGFIGSISRYLVSGAAQNLSKNLIFPVGTFTVNLLGCLLIGFLSQLSETRGLLTDSSRAFIIVGVLGGFTTFSAFGNETLNLLRDGETNLALINAIGSVIICLIGVWLGRAIAYGIWR